MNTIRTLLTLCAFTLFAVWLSSCCSPDNFTSANSFTFRFYDHTLIEKIELVGANKTVTYNAYVAYITLNPADTQSTYRIFYDGGSGLVTLGYTGKADYERVGCKEELVIRYDVHVTNTTFGSIILDKESPDATIYY